MKIQIESFEHACKITKTDPKKLPVVTGLPKEFRKHLISLYKIMIIIKATNKIAKWKADWADNNQYKYYPYFWISKNKTGSGFGFSRSGTYCACTDASVGSRLSVGTRDEAIYLGEKFAPLYKDIII
jgi:hypothetical protein